MNDPLLTSFFGRKGTCGGVTELESLDNKDHKPWTAKSMLVFFDVSFSCEQNVYGHESGNT